MKDNFDISSRGMACLVKNLGVVEAEYFIAPFSENVLTTPNGNVNTLKMLIYIVLLTKPLNMPKASENNFFIKNILNIT